MLRSFWGRHTDSESSRSRAARRARTAWLAFPLTLAVAAACGTGDEEPPITQGPGTVVGTTGGAGTGATPGGAGGTTGAGATPGASGGATGGATAGAGMTGATAGSSGAAGTAGGIQGAGGTTGATSGGAGGTTGAGAGMTGGTMGATGGTTGGMMAMPGGGAPLKTKCEGGEVMGCSSFMSPSGMEVQFGPYGAAMDANVGKGFELPVDPSDNTQGCQDFASIFGQPKEETDRLLDLKGLDLKLYTVYRPANWKAGEKYPLITWGNGTCAQPEGYGTLLRYIASHGFVVVAGNSRYVGSTGAMTKALDFMFKANEDMASPYYQKLDLMNVGAMGHSQGGAATVSAASDARIKKVILYNGGTSTSKPFLVISGDNDIPFIAPAVSDMKSAVNRATLAAWLFYHMIPPGGTFKGHLTLMQQPERVVEASVAWWKVVLKNDMAAKEYFVGTSCKLCGKTSEFEFGQKGIQ